MVVPKFFVFYNLMRMDHQKDGVVFDDHGSLMGPDNIYVIHFCKIVCKDTNIEDCQSVMPMILH